MFRSMLILVSTCQHSRYIEKSKSPNNQCTRLNNTRAKRSCEQWSTRGLEEINRICLAIGTICNVVRSAGIRLNKKAIKRKPDAGVKAVSGELLVGTCETTTPLSWHFNSITNKTCSRLVKLGKTKLLKPPYKYMTDNLQLFTIDNTVVRTLHIMGIWEK